MSAKFETVEKNKVVITVDVAPENFEAGIKRSFEKNKGKFKINGFRNGKAPRKMVEQIYGISAFYDDALNFVIPREYDAAVKELGLNPVSDPEYDLVEIESNTKLVFTATVYTKPEVILGDYKGLEIKKESAEVTDEDVDNDLKKQAEDDFRLVSVDGRPAAQGDTVVIDYEGSIDGELFEGGADENHNLEIGSNSFIPGFEEQIIGHNIGEEFVIDVNFPEDYHAEELKGKAAQFKINLHDIKIKEIPEINDDFAAEKSEFETLDEYKADIKKKLAEKKEKEVKNSYENQLVEKAAENAQIDIPECMIDNAVENTLRNYERQISNYGIKFEDYLKMTGSDIETIKADIRPGAEKNVRYELVLEAIADAEQLKPTDEQLQERFAEMAKQYGMKDEDIADKLNDEMKEYLSMDMKPALAVDFLVANASYVD